MFISRPYISSLFLIFEGTCNVACGLSFNLFLSSVCSFHFGISATESSAASVSSLTSTSCWQPLLLLLLIIFLIFDRFLALSINLSFLIFGMEFVCILPSIIVGLFLLTYLSRYLSFSISSKIWDLAFSFSNSSICHNFSAL